MGDKTGIQWTDATWNPLRGCSRVSAGCEHCYAEKTAARFCKPGEPYDGLVRITPKGRKVWNGEVKLVPEHLDDPLRWRRPRRVFVNSMSDLFHEKVPFEYIAAVFGVMAAAPQHTFQVLTKRPARAREFFAWLGAHAPALGLDPFVTMESEAEAHGVDVSAGESAPWPLPNVWLLVSVEDQATADARIPELLRCPAAVRGVSYEPALAGGDFSRWLPPYGEPDEDPREVGYGPAPGPTLDWIIVGGESGPGARPFDIVWARSTIAQCREAGVAVFMKQLGSRPVSTINPMLPPRPWIEIKARKGDDMDEWPADLRVREEPSRG